MKREISTLFGTLATSYGLSLAGILPSIFTVYFSTRVFSPEIVGQLTLITTAATLIQSLGFTWLTSALIRFGRDEYVKTGGIRQTFRVRLILFSIIWSTTLVVFGALYLFAHGLLAVRLGLSGRTLWAVPLFLTLWVFAAELNGYLRVFGKYVQLAGASFLGQLFQVSALALLYTYLGVGGIDWLIALSVGGSLSQSLFLILWLRRDNFRVGASTTGLRAIINRTIRYSVPAIGTSVLGYLYNPIEFFLIFYFVSIAAVGIFNIANSMNAIFVQFVMLFPNLMFPIQQGLKATGKRDMIQRYYHRIVPQLTILFAMCISIGIVCLPPIMRLLLSAKYLSAIGAFLILAYAEILHMTTALESIYPAVYDKLIQSFWVTGLQYVFQLTCYFLLIPRVGIEGVAWAWVAAYLASTVLLTHFVSQEFGVPRRTYISVGLSALLGMGALLLALSGIRFVFQLIALLGITIPLIIAIKVAKLFEYEDMKLLMATGIPNILQAPLRTIYRMLS